MTNRYSLADYQLILTIPDEIPTSVISTRNIAIGGPGENGEGSFVGTITVSRNTDAWKTTGDATGSWVHELSLDKTGICSVNINQISDLVIRLTQLCSIFESIQGNYPGLTITINSNSSEDGMPICICEDCYITKIPDQQFQTASQPQEWRFTCGRVIMYPSI